MTVYEETIAAVRELAARAATTESVLFCEQRPLTSLEARFAGASDLADRLRSAEEGYETALQSVQEAGNEASDWLRAVMLARSIETLPATSTPA